MNMVSLALRNLRRRPMRTALTTAGVALAIAAFVALIGLGRGMVVGLTNSLADRGTHLVVSEAGAMDILGSSVPEALVGRIAGLEGVAAAAGELVRFAPSDQDSQIIVTGWSEGSYLWRSLALTAGRLPRPGERRVAVLGAELARSLGKRPGDSIEIQFAPFTVVGIARSDSLMNRSMATVPLVDLQALIHRQGRVTVVHVRLAEPGARAAVAAARERVAAAAAGYAVDAAERLHDGLQVVRIATAVAWAISLVALVMGAVAVVNTLLIAVAERTGEIAVLSAVGWSRGRILASLLIEGLALSSVGGAIGAVLGFVGTVALAAIPAVRGLVEPVVTPGLVGEALLAALVLGAIGSLVPAWQATRIDPVDGLRQLA